MTGPLCVVARGSAAAWFAVADGSLSCDGVRRSSGCLPMG